MIQGSAGQVPVTDSIESLKTVYNKKTYTESL